MAKLSQLVKEMAEAMGVPEATVNQLARQVREAGMISSGGRGPGGAEMTPQDCTNLLLAVVSRNLKGGVAAHVAAYRASGGHVEWQQYKTERTEGESTHETNHDLKPEVLRFIPNVVSLGDLLDGLFERAADGSLLAYLAPGARAVFGEVANVMTDEQAVKRAGHMKFVGVAFDFHPAAYYAKVGVTPRAYETAMAVECRIHHDYLEQAWRERSDADYVERGHLTERTILQIGKLIGGDADK
jgi:hypothetical protein